jgi:hypothetical protein
LFSLSADSTSSFIDFVHCAQSLAFFKHALEMDDGQFRRLCGYTKKTMVEMFVILKEAYAAKHKRRGRHSKLDVGDMLMLACKYWREYVTFFSLAIEYGVAESTAHDITVWVENVLIKSGRFGLPGKKNS